MILWTSFEDYTNGLESNLVAEVVGLVLGIAVTYLVVNKILERRARAQYKPLLARLRERIDFAVSMLAHSWGIMLGLAKAEDIVDALEGKLIARVRDHLARPGSADALAQQVRSRDKEGPLRIGRHTVENTERVISMGDRISHIIASDRNLEKHMAELDDVVQKIDLALRNWDTIESRRLRESEDELVDWSRAAFSSALALKTYADEHLT